MKRKLSTFIFFVLLVGIFYLFNYSMARFFENSYVDMSDNNRYSLSAETKDILSNLKDKQTLRIYISPQITQDYPQTGEYSKYVTDLAKRYEKESQNRVITEIIEIEPYSPQEHEAEQYGIKEFLSKDGKVNLYFGGVITNNEGRYITIPNFVEMRGPYLEYDITSAIKQLTLSPKLPKIGVMAPDMHLLLDTSGKLDLTKNQNIFNQLSNKYQLVPISDYAVQIALDIKTMIVVNPSKGLANIGQYALDQFLLRGGNIIFFIDSIDEKSKKRNDDQKISQLLQNWGIKFSSDNTIGSLEKGIEIRSNNKTFPYMAWMNLDKTNFNAQTPIMQNLTSLSFRAPAAIEAVSSKAQDYKLTPLITISGKSGTIESKSSIQSYKEIAANNFKETNKDYILAAKIEGKFSSAYTENIMKGSKYEKEMLSFLPQALKKGQIYIISDIDFLYDETWSDNSFKNKNTTYGIVPWSENGLLLERILNSLNEKEDLTTLGIHPFLPKDSLGTKFKKEAEQDVSQAKEEKTQQLEQLLNKAEGINYQDYSLGSAKQINQLQEQITSLEKELRYLDYATDKAYKQKMKIYTMLSVILMLVYAGFITLWLRHRLKKRRISQEKN